MAIQFFIDAQGRKKSVLLDYSDYQKLIEKADELATIRAYDAARAKNRKFSSADEVFKRIEVKKRA